MPDQKWGHCRSCEHFGSPADVPLITEEARCNHRALKRFELTVFGASGCNNWELRAGLSPDAEGLPDVEERPHLH